RTSPFAPLAILFAAGCASVDSTYPRQQPVPQLERPLVIPPGTAEIHVLSVDGRPVVGAKVRVDALTVERKSMGTKTAGADGVARFDALWPARYRASIASLPGIDDGWLQRDEETWSVA